MIASLQVYLKHPFPHFDQNIFFKKITEQKWRLGHTYAGANLGI